MAFVASPVLVKQGLPPVKLLLWHCRVRQKKEKVTHIFTTNAVITWIEKGCIGKDHVRIVTYSLQLSSHIQSLQLVYILLTFASTLVAPASVCLLARWCEAPDARQWSMWFLRVSTTPFLSKPLRIDWDFGVSAQQQFRKWSPSLNRNFQVSSSSQFIFSLLQGARNPCQYFKLSTLPIGFQRYVPGRTWMKQLLMIILMVKRLRQKIKNKQTNTIY